MPIENAPELTAKDVDKSLFDNIIQKLDKAKIKSIESINDLYDYIISFFRVNVMTPK